MADRDLTFTIKAKDEASKTLDQIAGKAEDLEDQPYDVDLRIKGNLTDELERVAGEIKKTAAELEKLGEETVTFRIDASAFEKVQGDIGDLATDLKRIDAETIDITFNTRDMDVVGDRLRTAKGDIDGIGKSADSSKSALANMIGNSVQDLGALSGVAGSAGVAVGQMAEYFADARLAGEGFGSVLRSFIGVAAPIAALSIGIPLIAKAFESLTESAGASAAEIKAVKDALLDTKGAQTGYSQFIDKLIRDHDDLGRAMATLGVTQSDLAEGIKKTNPAVDQAVDVYEKWVDAAESGDFTIARERQEELAATLGLTRDELESLIPSMKTVSDEVGTQRDAFGKATKATAAYQKTLPPTADAAEDLDDKLSDLEKTFSTYAEAVRDADDALKEHRQALRAAADAGVAVAEANDEWNEFLSELPTKLAEAGADQRKLNELNREALDNLTAMADANARQAEEAAKANGATLSQAESQKIWNENMLDSAASLEGPMQDAILSYIGAVNGIPKETIATILADSDPNNLQQVKDEIDAVANPDGKDREAKIAIGVIGQDGAEKVLDGWASAMSREKSIKIPVVAVVPEASRALLGMFGIPSGGTRSAPAAAPTAVPVATTVTNVTNVNQRISVPTGADRLAVQRAINKANRQADRLAGVRP